MDYNHANGEDSREEKSMTDAQTPAELVHAFWAAFDRFEFAAVGPLLHDDFVCEWPQSGELIRGRDNLIAVNANYPGRWRITVQRTVACGGDVVTECEVRDGDAMVRAVSFFTVADGKIIRLREFWPDPMDAADWRAQWVERM
jgi:ketosteroid isomerase-like protein